jgi:hypothetical protein
MKVVLHIERLVLEGDAFRKMDAKRVGAAVEAELAGLLRKQGLANAPALGGAIPLLSAPSLRIKAGVRENTFGTQVARAVHSSIGAKP